ncbi:MAG: mechanosensitive ion channel protein [Phycisphaeraceae bacterium]|nr:MAG: mechanosensitive ion channel protein [Phycisphaeraceae bacterium]
MASAAALAAAPPRTPDSSPPADAADSSDVIGPAPSESGAESGASGYFDRPADEILYDIWQAELFKAGDTEVRLSQLVIAILVAVIGIWISRRITVGVRNRLILMKRIDRNAASAIQKVLFYLLAILVVMIALPIAGIPVTTFTVLGGALAIGVGFGAQTLFNNLISGIIIMTEQPIRLGDIVEVGSNHGRIEEIGNRCTRLRRFDGVDVLIPNSHFLENDVVNWTLFDNEIRCAVEVGVAYGSPTRLVEKLINQAVQEQELVDKSKDIVVLFIDFGNDALSFRTTFWTSLERPLDRLRLESEVRFRIDELFKENDITIAFPQRDVHLDSSRPLEVRVLSGGDDSQHAAAVPDPASTT